jgi:hypothetical protein
MYFASMAPTLAAQLRRQWKGEEAMVLLIWARAFVTLFRDVNGQKIENVYNVFDAKLLVANNCSMLIRMDDIFGR